MPIALVVITIRDLTLSSMCSRFVKNIGEDYSGAHQSVGPAIILRRTGPLIIPPEKLAGPRKQTGVDLKNLKKITRSTPKKHEKNFPFPVEQSIQDKVITCVSATWSIFLVCIA